MKKDKCPKNRALFSVYIWLESDNLEFIADYGLSEDRIIHLSRYSSTVIARLDENELEEILADSRCLGISRWQNLKFENNSAEILEQIEYTETFFESGSEWEIGMISSERETFFASSPQLTGPVRQGNVVVIPYVIPPTPALHPSVVLSEIIGEQLEVNGKTYKGIVEGAKVVFSTSETILDVLNTIEIFLDMGIKIINFSAGLLNPEGYSDFDRQVDRLIENNGFLFVTASGNRRVVSSPGISFNSLTVGNLQTKASPDTTLPPPWNSYCINAVNCSGYLADETTSHKPDVTAPGTYIPYITPDYRVYAENTGTSFACPWVTGLAYILAKENPALTYLELKALIALSCNREVISDAFNEIINGEQVIRTRTGCGMISVERALEFSEKADISSFIFQGSYQKNVTLSQGETLFAAFCFAVAEKGENISLSLIAAQERIVCDRPNQNLHIIEYTALESISAQILTEGTPDIRCALAVVII